MKLKYILIKYPYIYISKIINSLIMIAITVVILYDYSIYAMERNDEALIINTHDDLLNDNIDIDAALHRLETINRTRDPAEIERLRTLIERISTEHHIDLNHILYPSLQHANMQDNGNSGIIPEENAGGVITKIIVVTAIFAVGYILWCNWDVIRDALFDIGAQTLLQQNATRVIQAGQFLLTNPAAGRALARALLESNAQA